MAVMAQYAHCMASSNLSSSQCHHNLVGHADKIHKPFTCFKHVQTHVAGHKCGISHPHSLLFTPHSPIFTDSLPDQRRAYGGKRMRTMCQTGNRRSIPTIATQAVPSAEELDDLALCNAPERHDVPSSLPVNKGRMGKLESSILAQRFIVGRVAQPMLAASSNQPSSC